MNAKRSGAVLAIVLPAMLLVLSSLSLVTAQHRARALFVDLGRLQAQTRDLETEGSRLRIELGKASQPAAVAAAARTLGLKPAEARQTVFLPGLNPAELAAAGGEVSR